jgi:hypothetical protein
MKTNFFAKNNGINNSESIELNSEEMKSVEGGTSFLVIKNADGTYKFVIIARS